MNLKFWSAVNHGMWQSNMRKNAQTQGKHALQTQEETQQVETRTNLCLLMQLNSHKRSQNFY